jgi:hypothetical protein
MNLIAFGELLGELILFSSGLVVVDKLRLALESGMIVEELE